VAGRIGRPVTAESTEVTESTQLWHVMFTANSVCNQG
jgi:hypothetical protein